MLQYLPYPLRQGSLLTASISTALCWSLCEAYAQGFSVRLSLLCFSAVYFTYTADRLVGLKSDEISREKIRQLQVWKKYLLASLIATAIAGLVICFLLPLKLQMACLLAAIVGGCYAAKIKLFGLMLNQTPFLKELCVASCWSFCVALACFLVSSDMNQNLALGYFLIALSNSMYCDWLDRDIDKKYGKKSSSLSYPRITLVIQVFLLSTIVFLPTIALGAKFYVILICILYLNKKLKREMGKVLSELGLLLLLL